MENTTTQRTYRIRQRLAGTKQAYWTLQVWEAGAAEDASPIAVHTGKGRAGQTYVSGIRSRRYPKATAR